MSNLKITIDQLKNYLGTGLKMKTYFKTISGITVSNPLFSFDSVRVKEKSRVDIWTYDMNFLNQFGFVGKGFGINEVRPLCYRLSDLDKFIPELGFIPLDQLNKDFGYEQVRLVVYANSGLGWSIDSSYSNTAIDWNDMYPIIQKLFQWHFWPFGDEYFEQGLVVEKNLSDLSASAVNNAVKPNPEP